jgi:hypothetical protein
MGAIKPADLVNRDASDELDTEDAPSEEELVEA